jgi:hypothetical protein
MFPRNPLPLSSIVSTGELSSSETSVHIYQGRRVLIFILRIAYGFEYPKFIVINKSLSIQWDTRWRIWLMHFSTRRKVAGSICWLNPSSRTVALGSTLPLKEMSSMVIFHGRGGGGGGLCVGLITTLVSYANCLEILEPSGPVQALTSIALNFFYTFNLLANFLILPMKSNTHSH